MRFDVFPVLSSMIKLGGIRLKTNIRENRFCELCCWETSIIIILNVPNLLMKDNFILIIIIELDLMQLNTARVRVRVMQFDATFNKISGISWR